MSKDRSLDAAASRVAGPPKKVGRFRLALAMILEFSFGGSAWAQNGAVINARGDAGAISSPPQVATSSAQDIAAIIAPVFNSYRDVIAQQALLSDADTDSEKLIRIGAIDQAGRNGMEKVDASGLPADVQKRVWKAVFDEMSVHDAADLKGLQALLPAQGWFTISKYGKDAAKAAFFVVQHATSDLKFQEAMLQRMEPFVGTTEIDGQQFGMLWDRIALENSRPQRYGTQMTCQNGAYGPTNLEDPAHVDDRRRSAGFKVTEEEYLKRFKDEPCR